jgi:redox-sensing transcriptional repressor
VQQELVDLPELPAVTIDRLVRFHDLLLRLDAAGQAYTSSQEIGELLGCTPTEIRKDLAKLGRFGTRGTGYRVEEVRRTLGRIIGKEERWDLILIGAGNLGTALLRHGGIRERGFRFAAVFDADPHKIGTKLEGFVVQDISELSRTLHELSVEIGVLAVPATEARWAARLLTDNGIKAIMNFAPMSLWEERDVVVSNVDLTTEFEKLCFRMLTVRASRSQHAMTAVAEPSAPS